MLDDEMLKYFNLVHCVNKDKDLAVNKTPLSCRYRRLLPFSFIIQIRSSSLIQKQPVENKKIKNKIIDMLRVLNFT